MMGAVAVSTVSFTAFFVWAPTNAMVSLGLSQHDAMLSNTVGLLVLQRSHHSGVGLATGWATSASTWPSLA